MPFNLSAIKQLKNWNWPLMGGTALSLAFWAFLIWLIFG